MNNNMNNNMKNGMNDSYKQNNSYKQNSVSGTNKADNGGSVEPLPESSRPRRDGPGGD